MTITVESDVDTYLFLREGAGRDGTVLYENDDIVSGNTNSEIGETLPAGTYTIEVTTYNEGETGEFTLTISGLPAAVTPTPEPTPTVTITFGDLNWSRVMLQNRIAQYIAEKELVSNVVEIASRWFSSSSGDGPLDAPRQLGQDTVLELRSVHQQAHKVSASVQRTPSAHSASATP